ncbi:MAG: hypothetical protein A2840_03015 [Candidatus Buchananbacteria bacterium RIFCSPHIGHO2_01_FULL_47_11b]|uniref:Uncharacterized protein n=1 Tax=Candidatus Buchananbacteria bacterium RIFCSPHIGHO2_01_FULL_47_11b TaxID=1797537 RepID=A0A1G1Y3V7_9BACT|nr:MAG: hypothetical protein A2840_03015 [Candidatus Buchananbacteria bacterium RIFCSPHIGHO2_01_FULL_47_11b]
MKLLDPNEIWQEKSESTEQAHERTQKLAIEESHLVREVNLARENAKKEIEKIDAEVEEHRKQKSVEKIALTQEIDSLREQKKKLMQPINKIRAEADIALKAVEKLKADYERKIADMNEDKDDLQDQRDDLKDKEGNLNERHNTLDVREDRIAKEEARMKQSADNLITDWAKYHKAVLEHNLKVNELVKKDESLKTRETAIEIRQKEQDCRDFELKEEKRGIKSAYDAIETAKKHLNIKI